MNSSLEALNHLLKGGEEMSAQRALTNVKKDILDDPSAKDLGRVFLRPEGIKRLVVASPGNISVECELKDSKPRLNPKAEK